MEVRTGLSSYTRMYGSKGAAAAYRWQVRAAQWQYKIILLDALTKMTEQAVSVTFPESIATQRIELRHYADTDAVAIAELLGSNRQHLLRNFPELSKGLATPDEIKLFIEDCADQCNDRKTHTYGIWTKTPRQLIGQLKVKNILWNVPSAELSYFVGQSFLRRGYAREAVAIVMQVAFRELSFNRVYVRIIPSNIASLQLAQKLGMKHEGLHRNEFRCGLGELHDVNYYSLTHDDYLTSALAALSP